ncbi:MAG TPA: RHS repeat-associated core domain-containing protein, partial [Polyangiaceae bacterium]|nr:RHS repeat-associated core domain-containing protein [Polyangiaceae bacterium]
MRPRIAIKPPAPPAPLIDTSQSSPSTAAMADVINNVAAPFQSGPDPKKGTLGVIEHGIGAVMGVVGAPFELLDTGFALATAPLAALMPGLPAATLTAPHLGMPHAHAHPPSLIPPAPPVPLPSIGTLMCAGCVSVLIGGMPAARAGDVGLAPTCGSLSPAFEVYTGSSNTWIGGSRAARMTDITRHCNPASAAGKLGAAMGAVGVVAGAVGAGASAAAGEALQASMQAAQAAADAAALAMSALLGKDPGVPPALGALMLGNPTVLVGGFPLPDLLDVLGAALKGLKKLGDALENSPRVKKLLDKVGLCNDPGEPVNTFSGVVYNDFDDYRAPDGFGWGRHYRSDWNEQSGPLGFGYRHYYDRRLSLLRKRALYESHDGEQVSIPRAEAGGFVVGRGFVLSELVGQRYRLVTDRDEELHFEADHATPTSARLTRYVRSGVDVHCSYDSQGRLKALTERVGSQTLDTRLRYDAAGYLVEVLRGPRGGSQPSVSRYGYHDGCLVTWHDAIGGAARYAYDARRRMVRGTDRRGYSFHWHYDASGRCVRAHGDDGLWGIEARYEGSQSVFTEADGGEWTFKHFADGVVSHILDPEGGLLENVRDEDGRIIQQLLPGGAEYRWLYDATGKHYAQLGPFGLLQPPRDAEPNPGNPLAHDGPVTARDYLWGRPLRALPAAIGGLPAGVRQRASAWPSPSAGATRSESRRDELGRVVERTRADGSIERRRYDAEGNVVAQQTAPASAPSGDAPWALRSFTSWNLLDVETSPSGASVRREHTHRGKLRALVDANGNRTEYVRDRRHRLREVHRYGELYRRYVLDDAGAVLEEQGSQGETLIQYRTGPHGLHVAAALASGERYVFDYDARGRVTRASSSEHDVVQRHAGGRLELDQRDGLGVEHDYGTGARLRTSWVFGRFAIRYDYPSASRVRITTPDGALHELWQRGGVVVRENGNGTAEANGFDAEDRLVGRACWRHAHGLGPFWNVDYRYDADGRLRTSVDSDSGPASFEYDADGRLVAQHDERGARHYAYDAGGNLLSTPRHALIEYEPGNLLRHAEFDHYEHDGRRRRSRHDRQGGPVVDYRYDSQDHLVEVRWSDRDEVWRAAYDGLGRRLWREYAGLRTDFYWDGDRLAAERAPDGALRVYVYANEDALVPFLWLDYESDDAAPESGTAHYLFTAPSGMPLRIEDAGGHAIWKAEAIDPYGDVDPAAPACPTRLRFAGHFFDEHLGLFYNRFRDYDPALGRYLQPDPLGHGGGINLFAYAHNPLVDVDLRGLVHGKRTAPPEGDAPHSGKKQPPAEASDTPGAGKKPKLGEPGAAEWRYARYAGEQKATGKPVKPFEQWKSQHYDPALAGGRPGRPGSKAHQADVKANNGPPNNLRDKPVGKRVPDG